VAATSGGGKGQLTGRGAAFKGRMRQWPRVAETMGRTAGGSGGEAVGGQGGGHGPNAAATAAPLFGPCG
jgi:hypothetical protein